MSAIIQDEPTVGSATLPVASAVIVEGHISFYPVSAGDVSALEQISYNFVGQDDLELEQIFNRLVQNWKDATGGYSVTTRRYAHPDYQAILALGYDAVPL